MSDRLPPQDRESERALLGCVMIRPDCLADVRDRVADGDFYFDCHQRIYRAVLRLADARRPFDLVGVRNALNGSGELTDVGGDVYLAELTGGAGYSPEWPARRVRDAAARREAIRAAVELIEAAYLGAGPADDLLEAARSRLDRLANRSAGTEAVPMATATNELLDEIDARCRGERPSGTGTGFAQTDGVLCGGLPAGGLTVLAARPSVGKTSLACHVARNVCGRGGRVLFVSLEQPRRELVERIVAGESDVSGRRIRVGFNVLEARHHDRISKAADRVRPWGLWINDRPGQTAGQIAAGARGTKRQAGGLDLIVVDYLNLVRPENPKANRNEQTGASATRLREMARDLGAPVLLLAQLNREAAGDTGPPKLHQLRDSGEVEQVADAVLFLHRTGPMPTAGAKDAIELHVAKQRNGPLGVVRMEHASRVYTFAELEGLP